MGQYAERRGQKITCLEGTTCFKGILEYEVTRVLSLPKFDESLLLKQRTSEWYTGCQRELKQERNGNV